ncbi:hypothetical protein NFI96_029166 [Prochilodus magdalenae]|nr:hypothetical protein NFI96_029166 [Prochilodus magdalenae]
MLLYHSAQRAHHTLTNAASTLHSLFTALSGVSGRDCGTQKSLLFSQRSLKREKITSTVIWGLLLMLQSGINRFQEEFPQYVLRNYHSWSSS